MHFLTVIHIHLGWTILALALLIAILSLVPLRLRILPAAARRLYTAFMIVVDLQVLLGIISYATLRPGARPSLLHPLTMIVMAGVTHVAKKKSAHSLTGLPSRGWTVAIVILILLGIGWAEMLPRG